MAARTSHAPTLADVAEHLGVSRTTVSNAYNRPDQLSPTLRERVLGAARDLGYTGPDPVARSLRRGKAGSLGLVFDARLRYIFDDPAAVLFLSGVAAGCEEQGTGPGARARSCPRARPSSCARRSSTATSCSARPRTTSASRRSAPAGCPTSSSTSRPTSTARA